jgi:hypothetical protein
MIFILPLSFLCIFFGCLRKKINIMFSVCIAHVQVCCVAKIDMCFVGEVGASIFKWYCSISKIHIPSFLKFLVRSRSNFWIFFFLIKIFAKKENPKRCCKNVKRFINLILFLPYFFVQFFPSLLKYILVINELYLIKCIV